LIRDLSGKVDLVPKRQRVHIDAAYYVPMPAKRACFVPTAQHAPPLLFVSTRMPDTDSMYPAQGR